MRRLARHCRPGLLALAAAVAALTPATASTVPSADAPAVPAAATPPGTERSVIAARLLPGERIVLDGSLSHPAWARAPAHAEFTEFAPSNGSAPPQRTTFRVLFDDHALYVGVMAHDSRPQSIRDLPVRHDGVNRTQDFVAVYLDPIGQKGSAQFFRVNAAGSLADGIHTAADDNEDFSPDFDWDAKVQRRDDGWSTVLRIPFSTLRFAEPAPGAAPAAWRVMLMRRLPREQFHLMTSVPLPRGAPSFIDRLQPLLGVRLPDDHRFVTTRPSITLRQVDTRSGTGAQAVVRRESHVEASLDVKWRPRAELVVDATIKPDFSQVALDVPQLSGNSAFALYLPEKRPFFFESADLLRSPTDAFYTRSITQPRSGLRTSWRSPTWQGTLLAVSDRGGGQVLIPGPYGTGAALQPGSSVVAGRVRHAGDPWAAGALFASRRYEGDAGSNQVIGGDVDVTLGAGWRVRTQALVSRTTAQQQGAMLTRGATTDGRRVYAWLQRLVPDAESSLIFDRIDKDFRHDTGFVNQAGVQTIGLHHAWKWAPLGPFNNFDIYLDARHTEDLQTGLAVERNVHVGFWSAGSRNLEWWLEGHPLAEVRTRASGQVLAQHFIASGLVLTPAAWWPFLDTNLSVGRLADSVASEVRPGARWRFSARLRPLRSLELEPSFSQAWLYRDVAGESRLTYRESASQLLALWFLAPDQNLRLILQRSRLDRRPETAVQAAEWRSRTASLTWQWRRSAGTQVFVGATRDASPTSQERQTEVFVKLQMDLADLRQLW